MSSPPQVANVVTVAVSPAGVGSAAAAIVSACAVFTQFACAAYGKANRDVPKVKNNTASKLLFLAKEEVNLVNAFFQSVHLIFNGTAPVRFQFIQVMLDQPTNCTSKGCSDRYD